MSRRVVAFMVAFAVLSFLRQSSLAQQGEKEPQSLAEYTRQVIAARDQAKAGQVPTSRPGPWRGSGGASNVKNGRQLAAQRRRAEEKARRQHNVYAKSTRPPLQTPPLPNQNVPWQRIGGGQPTVRPDADGQGWTVRDADVLTHHRFDGSSSIHTRLGNKTIHEHNNGTTGLTIQTPTGRYDLFENPIQGWWGSGFTPHHNPEATTYRTHRQPVPRPLYFPQPIYNSRPSLFVPSLTPRYQVPAIIPRFGSWGTP